MQGINLTQRLDAMREALDDLINAFDSEELESQIERIQESYLRLDAEIARRPLDDHLPDGRILLPPDVVMPPLDEILRATEAVVESMKQKVIRVALARIPLALAQRCSVESFKAENEVSPWPTSSS